MTTDAIPTTFKGWEALGGDSLEEGLVFHEFPVRTWDEDMVDIEISYCGICGTDCHMLRNIWGYSVFPMCPGHEVAGKVVRVGKNVKTLKVGDRAGVGAQTNSCRVCEACLSGNEQFCPKFEYTYGNSLPDGTITKGGYAEHIRLNAGFAFKIPDGLASEIAAPLMCAGVTMYSPLKRWNASGKKLGIIGFGGLGYMGTILAKALGVKELVVFGRTSVKKADALEAGADQYIATAEDANWNQPLLNSLDMIINTADDHSISLAQYFSTLKFKGTFVQVGAGQGPFHEPFSYSANGLQPKGLQFCGSLIGSPGDIRELIQFALEKNLKPKLQVVPMDEVNEALKRMDRGEARYRFVLSRVGTTS